MRLAGLTGSGGAEVRRRLATVVALGALATAGCQSTPVGALAVDPIAADVSHKAQVARAEAGDAEVQFRLASRIYLDDPEPGWMWLCRAASQRHPQA